MAEYRLEMENVSKSFPGVKALDGVHLKVRPGTVHALMGENGAGKSTLMKCLFGIYKMDTGSIKIDGKETTIENPDDASGTAADTGTVDCRKYVSGKISQKENRAFCHGGS